MTTPDGTTNSEASPGATALGGAPAGASASPAAQGGANAPQGGGQAFTPPAGFQWPSNWKEALPPEIREEGALKVIHDIPNLAKSYVNAQKMVGAEKISIPSKHATEDDWKQVFQKLGVPEKVEEYKFEVPKDAPFDEKFIKDFQAVAHKAGVLPKQAEGLVKWFAEASKAEVASFEAQAKADLEKEVTTLRQEWGAAYDAKIAKAQAAAMEFGGKELIDILNKTGLGNSAAMIKAFSKAAGLLSEDKLGKDALGSAVTPKEADDKIGSIFGDKSHPYHDKTHPGHKAAVDEMSQLFNQKMAGSPGSAVGRFVPYNSRS